MLVKEVFCVLLQKLFASPAILASLEKALSHLFSSRVNPAIEKASVLRDPTVGKNEV